MADVDFDVWGKRSGFARPYPLAHHLLDTAAASLAVWDLWLRPGLRDLITAAVAPGDPAKARRVVAAVAGLHDVGKANSVFQAQTLRSDDEACALQSFFTAKGYATAAPVTKLGEALSPGSPDAAVLRRHEAVSLFHLAGRTWPLPQDTVGSGWSAAVAGGHHGRYHPAADVDASIGGGRTWRRGKQRALESVTSGLWQQQLDAHAQIVLDALKVDRSDLNCDLGDAGSVAIILITGLVCLADWLASNRAAVLAATGLSVATSGGPSGWLTMRREYFARTLPGTLGLYTGFTDPVASVLGGLTPSALQEQALTVGPGLWVVTHPTGEGKTSAALLRHSAGGEGEGIIFALPTRATTDSMWRTIQTAFSGTSNPAQLIHQYAQLDDFYIEQQGAEGLHRNSWLDWDLNKAFAPVAVSTCDQVLKAALRRSHSPARLLAMANKHVVIDEVHTFDNYQRSLLRELLVWFGKTGTRVTLLSATLPQVHLSEMVSAYTGHDTDCAAAYPGHTIAVAGTVVAGTAPSRREYDLTMNLIDTASDAVVDQHVALARQYAAADSQARIAVVVNTVDRCIAVGQALTAAGLDVTVLHSRMTQGHRKQVAEQIVARAGKYAGQGAGFIVVGTQVIEASLDVDFDHMVTDLAPTPSLIQRAGRLWRFSTRTDGTWQHPRGRSGADPVLDVIVPIDADGAIAPSGRYPYLMAEMKRSRGALTRVAGQVAIPAGVQAIVDQSVASEEDIVSEVNAMDTEDELLEEYKRLTSAERVVIKFDQKHGADSALQAGITYRALAAITAKATADDHDTRFIEIPTVTVALVDPTGTRRWAWAGSKAGFTTANDPLIVKAIQAATVPMKASAFRRITGIDAAQPRATPLPANGTLRDVYPVDIADLTYDDLLGLSL